MNHEQANRLLDRLKDGQHFSLAAVNKALEMTGDLDEQFREMAGGMRSAGMDTTLSQQNQGGGQAGGPRLVGADLRKNCQETGRTSGPSIEGQNE